LTGLGAILFCALLLMAVYVAVGANLPDESEGEEEPTTRLVATIGANQTGVDLNITECVGAGDADIMVYWSFESDRVVLATLWCEGADAYPWADETVVWNRDDLTLNITFGEGYPPPEGASIHVDLYPEDDTPDFPAAVLVGFAVGSLIVVGALSFAVKMLIDGRFQVVVGMGLTLVTGLVLNVVIAFVLNPCIMC
jgi:hypothetical protein